MNKREKRAIKEFIKEWRRLARELGFGPLIDAMEQLKTRKT